MADVGTYPNIHSTREGGVIEREVGVKARVRSSFVGRSSKY
jgi:hypothetical protein